MKGIRRNQKKSSQCTAMEISTPTKIIDGHSDIANISYTVVRGYGECAIVTTPSELFMYSVTEKNVPATWVFPSNSQECLTSAVYSTKDDSYPFLTVNNAPRKLMTCQGGSTFLLWNTTDISVKEFKRLEVDPASNCSHF